MQVEFHPPGLPRSGRFMVGDKKKKRQQNKKFHEINGFLNLQLGLSFELGGLRLRLTNKEEHQLGNLTTEQLVAIKIFYNLLEDNLL